jgi:hypothetical protein
MKIVRVQVEWKDREPGGCEKYFYQMARRSSAETLWLRLSLVIQTSNGPIQEMKTARLLIAAALVLSALFFTSPAKAAPVEFTFTGTGASGSIVTGDFTTEDASLVPGYFSGGGIYSNFSLTISNIPGGGPASFSLGTGELINSWLNVDSGSVVFVAPYGGKDYGAPFYDHYEFDQPSQPYLPSLVFQSTLSYDGHVKDLITWTPATAVPEPSACVWLMIGLTGLLGRTLGMPKRGIRLKP